MFADVEMVIIARDLMPAGVELRAGTTFPVTGQLKDYPNLLFGLDNDVSQLWRVLPHRAPSSIIANINSSAMKVSTGVDAIEHICNTYGLKLSKLEPSHRLQSLIDRLHR